MDATANKVQQHVHRAWQQVRVAMGRMSGSSRVSPTDAYSVFTPRVIGEDVHFDVQPTVFQMPERATALNNNLYIVVAGTLTFEGPYRGKQPLRSKAYATRIGYFRAKSSTKLEHVYGAHFDMDVVHDGHPVFHAQIKPFEEYGQIVVDRYQLSLAQPIDDHVGRVLRNVRTPSAQMDFFSTVTQLCADHLLTADSGPTVQTAFGELRRACGFFRGAAYRAPRLLTPGATGCYRSPHWY